MSEEAGGIDSFEQIRSLAVAAGEQTVFEPGVRRLLLKDLHVDLEVGMRFPVFLNFMHAGRLEVEVWVEEASPSGRDGHAGH